MAELSQLEDIFKSAGRRLSHDLLVNFQMTSSRIMFQIERLVADFQSTVYSAIIFSQGSMSAVIKFINSSESIYNEQGIIKFLDELKNKGRKKAKQNDP